MALPHLVIHSLDAYGDPLRLRAMINDLQAPGNAINPQMLGPLYRHDTDFRHWYLPVEPPMVTSDDGDPRAGFRVISVLVPLFDLVQLLSMKYPDLEWLMWFRAGTLGFSGMASYKAGEQVERTIDEFPAEEIPPETLELMASFGFTEESA